jgi:hypothetical protein
MDGGKKGTITIWAGQEGVGSAVTLDSDPQNGIILRCGQNQIVIAKDGITLDATSIKVKAKVLLDIATQISKNKSTLKKDDDALVTLGG